jgi:hypothetical protein
MAIGCSFFRAIGGYQWLLVPILLMAINGYWLLFYWWLLVVILLMAIDGYSINGYWWLLY